MNITGELDFAKSYTDAGRYIGRITGSSFSGAFSDAGDGQSKTALIGFISQTYDYELRKYDFNASRTWTGEKILTCK